MGIKAVQCYLPYFPVRIEHFIEALLDITLGVVITHITEDGARTVVTAYSSSLIFNFFMAFITLLRRFCALFLLLARGLHFFITVFLLIGRVVDTVRCG